MGAKLGETTSVMGINTRAISAQNAALAEQAGIIEGMTVAWGGLTKAELAARDASIIQPVNMPGLSGGGLLGGLSNAAIPVMVAYFGGEAVAQMLDNNPFTGEGWTLKKIGEAVNNPVVNMGLGASVLSTLGILDVQDDINAMNERNGKPIMDISALLKNDWTARKNTVNPYFPNLPSQTDENKKTEKDLSSAIGNQSDAIVGGGQKVINITFKNFVETWNQHVGSNSEGVTLSRDAYEKMFLEVLQSARAAQ